MINSAPFSDNLLASSNKEYFHELTTPVLTESTITTQANQCDVLGGVNEDSSAIKLEISTQL